MKVSQIIRLLNSRITVAFNLTDMHSKYVYVPVYTLAHVGMMQVSLQKVFGVEKAISPTGESYRAT